MRRGSLPLKHAGEPSCGCARPTRGKSQAVSGVGGAFSGDPLVKSGRFWTSPVRVRWRVPLVKLRTILDPCRLGARTFAVLACLQHSLRALRSYSGGASQDKVSPTPPFPPSSREGGLVGTIWSEAGVSGDVERRAFQPPGCLGSVQRVVWPRHLAPPHCIARGYRIVR